MIQRIDSDEPWGVDNFYWREPIVSETTRAEHAAYMAAYGRKMRAANPDYHKSLHLKKRYGITIDRYNEMLTEQRGCCALCRKAESNEIKGKVVSLAVDHDHKTGAVRALLCSACNTALGLFNDDTALLDAAKAYLQSHLATPPQT
jgi:hypothetical protein